jgi:hypothetical protein
VYRSSYWRKRASSTVLAQSRDRVAKERAMRRRRLKRLWTRLKQLSTMALSREELLMKLGAARDQSRTALAVRLNGVCCGYILLARRETHSDALRYL